MLKQRVITAVVLLAILLPALFYRDPAPFSALVLLMVSAGAWEWARMNGCKPAASILTGVISAALGAAFWQLGWVQQPHTLVWLVAGAAWVLITVALIKAGVPVWSKIPFAVRWVGGVAALLLAGMAMVQARLQGINFLLSVLALVWAADICAYFAGRAFGQRWFARKLAPSISPGKSWEGAMGGALGVMVMACIWVWLDQRNATAVPSLYSYLASAGMWLLVLGVLFMTAMSVTGDLVESLIKRSAGVKDSSQLLPGHGGVLDRIDALLPTLPLAMMLTSLLQS